MASGSGTRQTREDRNDLAPETLVDSVEPQTTSSTMALQALDEAVRILTTARRQLASGSGSIWQLVDHACKHVESQIDALLRS
jgi:hypothetical protein